MTLVFLVARPFKGIGGMERIVVTLAEVVAKGTVQDVQLLVILPEGSYVETELKKLLSPHIKIKYLSSGKVFLEKDDIVVCWSGVRSLFFQLAGNPRLVIWSILAGSPLAHLATPTNVLLRRLVERIRRKVAFYLIDNKALHFMDGPTLSAFEEVYNWKTIEQYFPVPIAIKPNDYLSKNRRNQFTGETINISYIGRGHVVWKVHPFVALIRFCLSCCKCLNIRVYTDYNDLFVKQMERARIDLKYVRFINDKHGKELTRELGEWSDIHVGMGTSVLEGASCGIPSICIDPMFDYKEPLSWRWLFNCKNYDLGDFICRYENSDVSTLKKFILTYSIREEYSQKTYEYVYKNHAASQVLLKIINNKSTATLPDYIKSHSSFLHLLYVIKSFVKKITTRNI